MPHTPGPWRAENNPTYGASVRGGTSRNFATGKEEEGFVAYRMHSMADAYLTAAAPSLLAALEDIATSGAGDIIERKHYFEDVARKAVALARGEVEANA